MVGSCNPAQIKSGTLVLGGTGFIALHIYKAVHVLQELNRACITKQLLVSSF